MTWNDANQQGFDDGKSDALANKGKNYNKTPFWKSMLSSNVTDSYCKGYDEGYRKGCDQR